MNTAGRIESDLPVDPMDAQSTGIRSAKAEEVRVVPSEEDDPGRAAALAAERLAAGKSPDLRATDPWAEAGRKILRFHLARTLARVPGVIAGEDIEEVHAMRVAARRMRAAWRVFGDGFEREARQRYRDELRAVGSRLGAVRDLDVLIGTLVTYGERRGARQRVGLEPLLVAWQAEREARRIDLMAALGSERFTEFIRDYQELVETPGLDAIVIPPHAPGIVRNRMPAEIWHAYQAVWAFDDGLDGADLTTLHQLRIAAKWLRCLARVKRGNGSHGGPSGVTAPSTRSGPAVGARPPASRTARRRARTAHGDARTTHVGGFFTLSWAGWACWAGPGVERCRELKRHRAGLPPCSRGPRSE